MESTSRPVQPVHNHPFELISTKTLCVFIAGEKVQQLPAEPPLSSRGVHPLPCLCASFLPCSTLRSTLLAQSEKQLRLYRSIEDNGFLKTSAGIGGGIRSRKNTSHKTPSWQLQQQRAAKVRMRETRGAEHSLPLCMLLFILVFIYSSMLSV